MLEAKISVHRVNEVLIGLVERPTGLIIGVVLDIPGGGRVLIDSTDSVERISRLLGPNAQATNPFEQRKRKEFLRRARRSAAAYIEQHAISV